MTTKIEVPEWQEAWRQWIDTADEASLEFDQAFLAGFKAGQQGRDFWTAAAYYSGFEAGRAPRPVEVAMHEYEVGFLAGRASAQQWRSMDSAPKDGTKLLGSTPNGICTIYWTVGFPTCPDNPGLSAGWVSNDGETCPGCPGYSTEAQNQPTHWLPLPPPPTETQP